MSVSRKYLWLIMAFLICFLPAIALAAEKDRSPELLGPERKLGDDIQSMVSLRYGSRGEDVKLVQSYLIKHGFLQDKVDGMFGSLTLQAVKDFQKQMGLPIDGVVVGRTFQALKEYKPAVAAVIKEAPNTTPAVSQQVNGNMLAGPEQLNDSPSVIKRTMITNTPSRGAVSRTPRSLEATASENKKGQENINAMVNTSENTAAEVAKQQPVTKKETEKQVQTVLKNDKNPQSGSPDVNTIIDIPDCWRPIRLEATAYTRYDAGCTDYTYRGNYLQRGLVAVDPTVIPLGTRMYIPGYGFAVADDIGGAIQGHRVDLSMDTLDEAFAFGRRVITVYIIDWSILT